MDLSTRYLGFDLAHPLMPGASPLGADLDAIRRLEDAGASMITLHSLFEEQVRQNHFANVAAAEATSNSSAEAQSFFPSLPEFGLGPDEYLDHVRRVRLAVNVPVVASLNGTTQSGWIDYARLIEQAGAHALELNVYFVAADLEDPAWAVEDRVINLARQIKQSVSIPVTVKLSPFFSSVAHLARRLESAKIDGLVLFNRFYQPDIDIKALEVTPRLEYSTSAELRLRLHWLAILSGRIHPSLAVSGGVHTVEDVIKAIMAGAHAVQVVSALLVQGPEHLTRLRQALSDWLEQNEYDSLSQMQGSMNLRRCPDPAAFQRAHYMAVLQGWHASHGK